MERLKQQENCPYKKIRYSVLCGKCTASMFMFWDIKKDERIIKPAEDEPLLPSQITRNNKAGLAYVVRCDYLKSAIFCPNSLKQCEAFKPIKNMEVKTKDIP